MSLIEHILLFVVATLVFILWHADYMEHQYRKWEHQK